MRYALCAIMRGRCAVPEFSPLHRERSAHAGRRAAPRPAPPPHPHTPPPPPRPTPATATHHHHPHPHSPHRSPTAWAAGAGGRHQRACGPLPSRLLPASKGYATALCFPRLSALHLRRTPGACGLRVAKRACILGDGAHVGRRAVLFSWMSRHAPVAIRSEMCSIALSIQIAKDIFAFGNIFRDAQA
jgi:hypothetical protein